MGGGSDSRIPSILHSYFLTNAGYYGVVVRVVCRTYNFNPEVAHEQISLWIEELKPDLVIGESLGSLHALRVSELPVLLVSPALNTPFYFELLSKLTWIPGVTRYFQYRYKPREGDRQQLSFTSEVLKKYSLHGREALGGLLEKQHRVHAFFGSRDHYRRSGVVSIKKWKKLFGDSFSMYEGTHFMEEEFIYSLLVPKIVLMLNIKQ